MIAVDQDPKGAQGSVAASNGSQWTLNKPLANGDKAVVLFNVGSSAAPMSASFASLGLDSSRPYILRDLWKHAYLAGEGTLSADVASHGVMMYRITPDTFSALEQVVASYSTDPEVTAGLNDKLAAAAAAPNATSRDQQIGAFSNQVGAQTGKALTQAQAATLTELADALR